MMNHPKIEVVDFGSNCRLGVCCMQLTGFWFYVYLSLVFKSLLSLVDLFTDLVALFLFLYIYRYRYIFPFSLFGSVCVYASLCDFSLCSFAFTICPRDLSVHSFIFFSIVLSACYHWWICFLIWLLSSFFLSFFFNYFLIF